MEAKFPEIKGDASLGKMLAAARGLDFSRPNRFEVHIFEPFGLAQSGADMRALSLRCDSVTMPFRTLSTTEEANTYGPVREIVSGVSYAGNVALTFQSSGNLDERVFFEEWQKTAFNEHTFNIRYHENYVSEVQIYLLDNKDERRYGVVLHEAYPTTLNQIDLSQDADGIIVTSVELSFRWWQTLDTNRDSSQESITVQQSNAGDNEAITRTNAGNQPSSISKLGMPQGF